MALSKKIILLGDPSVGKTSLIRRFVLDEFDDKYIETIGVKVSKKPVKVNDGTSIILLDLLIYDILGQQDFRSVRRKYMEGASGAILVADLSRVETIDSLQNFWMNEIKETLGPIPIIMIGNKLDLVQKETDTIDYIRALSEATSFPLYLCSALTKEAVNEGFEQIAEIVVKQKEEKVEKDVEPEKVMDKRDMENIRIAADAIMHHFCGTHDDPLKGMEICTMVFNQCDFSLENPKGDVLLRIIELLSEQERQYLTEKDVMKNKMVRLRHLSSTKKR